MVKNIVKHFILITRHRIKVFKLCCKAGIPWRGFVHDLSKYSPIEFFESAKYYNGNYSPIFECKKVNGYSEAWLHHKGRNKHHYEYWYDDKTTDKTIMIPYKYAVEMICDSLSASMIYTGKGWKIQNQIEYWEKNRKTAQVNQKTANFLTDVYNEMAENGVYEVLNKKTLQKLYKKNCE